MKSRYGVLALVAWLQLLVSVILASAIVWGYITYRASLGQFIHSLADSIGAISRVVAITAETVEARRDLLNETGQLLATLRNNINQLKEGTEAQAKLVPQYAANLLSAASLVGKVSQTFQGVGEAMAFSVPSIRWEGVKPTVTTSRPLEAQAEQIKANARDLKGVGEGLAVVGDRMSRDGQKLSEAVLATSQQALKVIAEAERTLRRLNTQDLPKALEELRATSRNLSAISAQVDSVSNIGLVLLVVGLVLALWCFLNSLIALMLAHSRHAISGGKSTTAPAS